jgi:tetratricopeptide (TPR) repeat protein
LSFFVFARVAAMKGVFLSALILLSALSAFAGAPTSQDLRKSAEGLWEAREDMTSASSAARAFEEIVAAGDREYETFLRLSRLHLWLGQNLEPTNRKKALDHYGKGARFGRMASEADPTRPGGYFFEAANLALKVFVGKRPADIARIPYILSLNEKAASLQPDFFFGGPDRVLCVHYNRLPALLGGDPAKAAEHGRRAVEASRRFVANYTCLAEAYFREGKNGEAIKTLSEALEIPDDAAPGVVPEQRLEKKRAGTFIMKIGK